MRTRGRERGSGAAAGTHSARLNWPAGWGQAGGGHLGGTCWVHVRHRQQPAEDLGCLRALFMQNTHTGPYCAQAQLWARQRKGAKTPPLGSPGGGRGGS